LLALGLGYGVDLVLDALIEPAHAMAGRRDSSFSTDTMLARKHLCAAFAGTLGYVGQGWLMRAKSSSRVGTPCTNAGLIRSRCRNAAAPLVGNGLGTPPSTVHACSKRFGNGTV